MLGDKKRFVCDKFKEDRPNLWIKFNELKAGGNELVDLGMGFPTFATPSFLLEGLAKIARDPLKHQSPHVKGIPLLVDAISALYTPLLGRSITPDQVITGVGAQGVLYLAMRALIRPGDEVILLEPAFECYEKQIQACGGVPVFVPYNPPTPGSSRYADEWHLDPAKLESALSHRTSLLVLNNPHNPLGKSLSREEVEMIAAFCRRNQLLVVSDEVYECMVFDGRTHVRIAAIEGMWERTLSVHSAGKLFSATGWRMGWGVGPAPLIGRLQEVVLRMGLYGCAPLQYALAEAISREAKLLGTPDGYFNQLRSELEEKRDILYNAMKELGLSAIKPSATYFLLLEVPRLQEIADTADPPDQAYDVTFSLWMARELGISSIPVSSFSHENHGVPDRFIRLCFCKQDQTLESAMQKLTSLKQRLDDLS